MTVDHAINVRLDLAIMLGFAFLGLCATLGIVAACRVMDWLRRVWLG